MMCLDGTGIATKSAVIFAAARHTYLCDCGIFMLLTVEKAKLRRSLGLFNI
jgi:hypothetical protein